MSEPVILGGGVAGIAAAVELAEAGARPTLIESRPYLGGRVRSFRHAGTGDEIDNGQHLFMGCYHQTFRLLDRLGTRSLVELQPALRVEFRDIEGKIHHLAAPRLFPSPLGVAAGMLRFNPLSLTERLGLFRAGIHTMMSGPRPDESVAAYLKRLGQSEEARRWLWDPIILATLNTSPEEASATLFATVMRLAFLGRGDDSKLGLPRAGLSALLAPAEEFIRQRGGRVMTGSPVRRIEESKDIWRIHLGNGEAFETDALVSALPWRSFRSLFASHLPDLPAIHSTVPHNAIFSLYLWFDDPLEEIPDFTALIGTKVQWVFNRRKIVRESNERFPGLLSCVISAADDLASKADEDLIAIAEREVRSVFSFPDKIRLLASLVIREKQATFAANVDIERLRPTPGYLRPGLFIAGDWTATGLPGTIEGGVRSGVAAAGAVLGAHSPH